MRSLEDFVRAGQVAQDAVDALALTAQLKLAREHVDAARATLPHPTDSSRHRVLRVDGARAELEAALRELDALGRALAAHFERAAPRASRYACTCGFELTGPELAAFLDALAGPAPASITCRCGGVAVRLSS